MSHCTAPMLAILLAAPLARAADWPQWRGPDRNGISRETSWIDTGIEAWRFDAGHGHSSFAVVDGRVYTLGHDVDRSVDVVWCLDAATGAEVWRHEYASEIWNEAHDGGTCTTPAVGNGVVFASNREGNVFALDAATGDVRWHRQLATDMDLTPPNWGFSGSPLLIDDVVIINMDRIVALDASSGETRWSSAESYGSAYGTPVDLTFAGRRALAVHNGRAIAILDFANGEELYEQPWGGKSDIHCSTPVVDGDRLFVSAGYGEGCTMYRATGGALEEDWASRAMNTKLNGVIASDGFLYGLDNAILKCTDLAGNERWRQRGIGMGALAVAGDRLIVLSSRGELVIADAAPESYHERTREKVLDDDATYWTTPVLADGRIYCRSSHGTIVCRDHRPSVAAQTAPDETAVARLPEAAKLFRHHEAAAGGAEALAARPGLHLSGVGERRDEGGIGYRIDIYWTPDRYRWVTQGPWMNGERAWDGERAWMVHPFEGARILDGEAREALIDEAYFAWETDWADRYASMTTVGRTTFDERDCWEVEAITADGRPRRLWFEVDTGLHAGQADANRTFITRDYRRVGDTMVAHAWDVFVDADGILNEFRFDSAEVAARAAGDFAMPESVRMLTLSATELEAINAALRKRFAAYMGTYVADSGPGAGEPGEVGVRHGQFGYLTPDGVFEMVQVDGDEFTLAISPQFKILYRRDESGAITGFTFTDPGGEQSWNAKQ